MLMHSLLLCSLLAISVLPSIRAKKSSHRRFIVDVDDIKPFKKLQRTHTNLLVLFSKSEKEASKKLELLGDVAKEIKGKGTIAFINCGESKKLCKKLKVTPKPLLLKHFKDGKFNKDYDRKNAFKSLISFMNNPTGDAPWEEESGSEDVYHIETNQQLNKLLKKQKQPVLIMFYAPWCGFCKKFKPDYALAATELKEESVLAGMDVDNQEGYSTRMKYNITGFPTLIYFEKGDEKYRYSGKYEKDILVEWMKNPTQPAPEEKEEQWSDKPSDVVHLKDDTFDDFTQNNPSVLVMFYAPWCGHCKQMKPEYDDAAKTLKDEGVTGILAAVDSTKAVTISKRFKVEGYPTVKYFKDGKLAFDVNERKADKIISFMKDPKEPPPPPPPEPEWSDVATDVHHLNDDTFKNFLKKKKHVLVMFYAPWCGHCKNAKPEVDTAAEHHKSNTKVAFAGVDCTQSTGVCEQFGVQGYPTFRYFNYGKKDFKYTGGRTSKDFIQFMEDPREGPPPPPPESEWSTEPSNVEHLTDDDFEEFIKEHDSVLVMFYAPWCGHCKAMKPDYTIAADEIETKKINGVLAAVDCTKHRNVAKKFQVTGFPTIKYFSGGKFAFDYGRSRTKDDLVDFMNNPGEVKPEVAKKKEKPKEESWSDVNQDVAHLEADTFDDFIKTHPSTLVMFYAPWCQHCQKLKPAFGEVAKEINTEKMVEGAIAAVDCTQSKDLCKKYDVKGYPTLQYFKDGEFQFKYTGRRTADGFREFMKDPKKPKPAPLPEDWSKDDSKVVFLNDETFDNYIANNSHVLIMFYAPWCGHCNSMKKSYYEAAKTLDNENPNAKLAAVDCTRNKKVSGKVKISGYPTVKLYKNGKDHQDYDGDRSMVDLVRFMREKAGDDDDKTALAEPTLIKTLTKDTFHQFLKQKENVLVMFYAPWCGHCKNAKPKYEKAAEAFKSQPQKVFAIVDCTKEGALCDKEDVNGYPTLKHYNHGTFVVEYDGDRVTGDFILFMDDPPLPFVPKKTLEKIAETEKPEEQEKPEEPAETGEPEIPEKPVEPEETGEPKIPEKTVEPEETGEPEIPEKPVEPEETGEPEIPEKPVEPEEHEETGEPEIPEKPVEPEETEEPEIPEKTVEPEEPEETGEPEIPEKTVEPEETGEPEIPEKPVEPEEPEETGEPEIPEKPVEPEEPVKAEEPQNPEKPVATEKPEKLSKRKEEL